MTQRCLAFKNYGGELVASSVICGRKGDWLLCALLSLYSQKRREKFGDNDIMVLGVSIESSGIPYDDAEMENLKALREQGAAYSAFYEVLKTFNSRSGKALLDVMEDLEFDIDVKDIAKAAMATFQEIVR